MLHSDTFVLTMGAICDPHPAVTFRHTGLDGSARAMRGCCKDAQRSSLALRVRGFRATPPKNGAIFDTFF